jgi:tetraacyldisaccharide 4'-kinase
MRRDYLRRRRLPVPVISIGNLSMGGTGKTPCVLRLTELLRQRGHHPAILTRGYGRNSPVRSMILAPGAAVRPEATGDEPQIFLRSKLAPIGIGADRFETGSILLQAFPADVVLLDDGFQHVKLARNVDVVLLDGVHPLGGGEVFPIGRLREPIAGLARADVVVITRSDLTDLAPAIERMVRHHNPAAPIVRACVEPEWLVDVRTGERFAPGQIAFDRVGAFCGLGNPQGFRRTLEGMGVKLVCWIEFDDHHRYTPLEVRRIASQFLASGVTAILTTEKDAINLHDGLHDQLSPLPLYWLQIAMRFDDEAGLMAAIESKLVGYLRGRA